MRKTFIYTLTILFFFANKSSLLLAQIEMCGVKNQPIEAIQKREARILQLKKTLSTAYIEQFASIQYIPIKPHIVTTSAGTGGLSLSDLNTALAKVNQYFLSVGQGVQFYICGQPNYIANDSFYNFEASQESIFCDVNDVTNAINIYFPNSVSFGATQVAGYSYFPSTVAISNRIFVKISAVSDNRSLIHELGHYFNLLHTFQNSVAYPLSERELVNGSNCSARGDLICDTPADPFGRDSVTLSGCNYTGTALDPNGQLYTPALNNIMSYYPSNCGNVFTTQQYSRMQDGVLLRLDSNNNYTLNCTSTVIGSNIPSNVVPTIVNNSIVLSFSDNSSNETGFIIERSSVSATSGFVPIAGLSPNITSYTDQTTTSFTTYYYRIKASNSADAYSTVATITTNYLYCTPLYDYSCNSINTIIDDFILKENGTNTTIISNIDSNCSPANYGDFTSISHNVTSGSTYTATIRAVSNGVGSYFNQHCSIWIDYNHNGVYDNSEQVFKSDNTNLLSPTTTTQFTIPSTVSGLTRMRVRSRYSAMGQVLDPCVKYEFGETEDYMLNVISSLPPSINIINISSSNFCAGGAINIQIQTVNFTSTSFTVQLSDTSGNNFQNILSTLNNNILTATIPISTTTGTNYRVKIISNSPVVSSSNSSPFTLYAKPNLPTVTSPVNYFVNQVAAPLQATGQNLLWYYSTTGAGSTTTITPSTATVGSTTYYVSQTVNGCESNKASIVVTVQNLVTTRVCLHINMYMEGTLSGSRTMTTQLYQKNLLPGQQGDSLQPYRGAPWYYNGTEARTNYDPNVVDWILLSLRTNPTDTNTQVFRTAALLKSDGTVQLLKECPNLYADSSYYVVVEHRNHIGAISHVAVPVVNDTITYDFSLQQSYIPANVPASGQKKIGNTYCLIAGDGAKQSFSEVNANDYIIWRQNNGKVFKYIICDYNLDGEINAQDSIIWRKNNGLFSAIIF